MILDLHRQGLSISAIVRAQVWSASFEASRHDRDQVKIRRALLNRLTDAACFPAWNGQSPTEKTDKKHGSFIVLVLSSILIKSFYAT